MSADLRPWKFQTPCFRGDFLGPAACVHATSTFPLHLAGQYPLKPNAGNQHCFTFIRPFELCFRLAKGFEQEATSMRGHRFIRSIDTRGAPRIVRMKALFVNHMACLTIVGENPSGSN